ncbi:MAG TPA: AbrB/MazE/SpoVT family DNA-binding domain-containing protein, partial [Actinomycetota bacterium]|nr:AbrB/MazE/SpoVT family DNA-binding domain-containing protein [Actinomycetota bacterium]
MNRKLDVLGRIVIPAEIRKSLDLKEGGVLDISLEEDRIILTPRQ